MNQQQRLAFAGSVVCKGGDHWLTIQSTVSVFLLAIRAIEGYS
jgi:hypothetical protein